jgi:hypothetical protein
MTWEEACKYLWQGLLTRRTYRYKIENGYVYYVFDNSLDWFRWVPAFGDASRYLNGGYRQLGLNPHHITYSPEEQVCKKVRLLEKRWLVFQAQKKGVSYGV